MFGIGPMELVVIVVVALLIFGPQKLPEFARTIGKGLAEFRRASNDLRQSLALDELQHDLRKTMNDATRAPVSRPAQAGDTLPPGSNATAATSPAAPGVGAPADPTAAADPNETASPKPSAAADANAAVGAPVVARTALPWKGHPGELPEGIDHEHHDPAVPEATTPEIDSELGNVPVTGVDPSETRRG
ncbi:MAG: twin-arginine translocase TatA/TatE family subunit [Deltaproteobacteria bacterium]|nr:twin-arginine translocase TatA/TatE family subunit [Deltaproteobacteria bacterium]